MKYVKARGSTKSFNLGSFEIKIEEARTLKKLEQNFDMQTSTTINRQRNIN